MNKYEHKILGTLLLLLMMISLSIVAQQRQTPIESIRNDSHKGITDAQIEKASMLLPGENIDKKIKENIFIRVETSKKECYIGEPLLVVYKLCTRLRCQSKVVSPPSFSGCSVVEMTSSDVKDEDEKINGKLFKTYTIRKVQLFPLQEGKLSLGTATVDNQINFIDKNSAHNLFTNKNISITNDSAFVNIKALPIDTTKSGFTGAIGKFFMIGKVTKVIDTADGNNQLEITISGNGNFMSVTCPTILWPDNVQAFEAKSTELLDKLSFPILGEKKFVIPFTCKKEGEVIIPAIIFKYFDADTKQFVSTEIDSIHIKVAPPKHRNLDALQKEEASSDDDDTLVIIISGMVFITMIAVFLIIWRVKKKKSQRHYEQYIQAKNSTVKEPGFNQLIKENKKEINNPLPVKDFSKMLSSLSEIIDEKEFYKEAIVLCENLLSSQTMKHEEEELRKIVSLCNEGLYSSVDANIYIIFLRLEKIIG